MSLKSLVHKSEAGTGLLAGLPWFIEYWARDSLISVPALNHLGEFEVSKSILDMFLSKSMPSKVDTEGNSETGFADTGPLLMLALKHYLGFTNDSEVSGIVKKSRELSDIAKGLEIEGGFVLHDPSKTWMDSYQRGRSALEVQSLWAAALREYNPDVSKLLESKIMVECWNASGGFFFDSKNPDMPDVTANALAPLCLDHVEGEKVSYILDKIQVELATKWGVRTRSFKDKDYRPDSYHKGSVWGLTTGAAACACLKHNRIKQGLDYLKSMASEVGENLVGGSAETLDADSGRLLGCGMQAWSSAMFITAVDEFLFGIRPVGGVLNIRPRIPDSWSYMERMGKRIGKVTMEFLVRRDQTRLNIALNFDVATGMEANLVLPFTIKKMIVNGKVFLGNSVRFRLKKQNHIIALQ
jgi:glycogen debranching enzyme